MDHDAQLNAQSTAPAAGPAPGELRGRTLRGEAPHFLLSLRVPAEGEQQREPLVLVPRGCGFPIFVSRGTFLAMAALAADAGWFDREVLRHTDPGTGEDRPLAVLSVPVPVGFTARVLPQEDIAHGTG